jgi:hypothetical protein
MSTTWARVTGIAAIVSVAMLFASLATWTNPQFNGPIGNITDYFIKQATLAQISVDLNLIGTIPSILFAVGLVVMLRSRGEEVLGFFSLAAAAMVGIVSIMFMTSNEALIAFAGQASRSELRLLMAFDNSVDNILFFAMGLWVGSVSLGVLRSGIFARWIGWVGSVSAVLMILSDMFFLTANLFIGMLGVLGFVIWTLAIGVSLLRSPPRVEQPAHLTVQGVMG